jgi:CBS domain-containing membrane protein
LPKYKRNAKSILFKVKGFHRNYRFAHHIVYRQIIVNPQDHLWAFWGASTVLARTTNGPLAQSRNLVGGHLISAFIGVTIYILLAHLDILSFSVALLVSFSIIAMQSTNSVHPPKGATTLMAKLATPTILGLRYFLSFIHYLHAHFFTDN